MSKKLQQFFILKFESGRLREFKYNIKEITIDEARLDGQLVSVADSQMIRTLHKVTGKEFSQELLDDLLSRKKRLSRKKNGIENRNKIKEVIRQIDDLLFVPQIISIQFDDKRHFQNIVDRGGVKINGRNYVYFMASAGQTRRDTALFIEDTLKDKVVSIFDNGRNPDKEFVAAKFSAYFALYSSSSLPIEFPRIAIVKDVLIKAVKKVDFSHYVSPKDDPIVQEEEKELEFVGADGQGLMSPEFAEVIAQDLELDYVPSCAIVRAPFMKGLLVTFPIHEFAEKVAKKKTFTDIYGNEVDIDDVDCIISESQFKAWDSYSSTQEYIENCHKNDLGFGISRVSPKEDKTHATTSYQFLQVLDLDDENIEKICKPTIDWISGVSGGDVNSVLLYLLGETVFDDNWFDRIDVPTQALLLENRLIDDSYFTSYVNKSIAKKCNDAKLGRLIFSGNYQFAIADPYGQMSSVMGMKKLSSLLQDGQHFSKYWNDRGVATVTCIRSPIVHSSEINTLHLQNNEDVNYWFRYINSGIVFPLYGISLDFAVLGGSDVDGDTVCTIDHESFQTGKVDGLPIFYESKKPGKIIINKGSECDLIDSQIRQIKSNKIGFLTNISSTLYSLLANFEKGSPEHTAILNRLKYGRVLQGHEIDRTKGIIVDPFLDHWVKSEKVEDDMDDDEKKRIRFNNSILAARRPYFMRFLYSHYNKKYMEEFYKYDDFSQRFCSIPLAELLAKTDRNEEEQRVFERYRKKSFFINNNSTMNRISRYMEKALAGNRLTRRKESENFDYHLLTYKFEKPPKRDLDKMKLLFKEWKSLKRNLRRTYIESPRTEFRNADQVYAYINARAISTISNNTSYLANLAVYLCYSLLGKQSKSFCWSCFGEDIIQNIRRRKGEKAVRVPLPSKTGKIDYLWGKYGIYLLNIED